MEKLNELQKEIICDKVYKLTVNLNDDELKYAIESMIFWQKERQRQDEEIKKTEANYEK